MSSILVFTLELIPSDHDHNHDVESYKPCHLQAVRYGEKKFYFLPFDVHWVRRQTDPLQGSTVIIMMLTEKAEEAVRLALEYNVRPPGQVWTQFCMSGIATHRKHF
eukprot:scpid37796/ scgid9045/ 